MKKKELSAKLGLEFDEVASMFSEETLSTMSMTHIVGGTEDTNNCTVSNNCGPAGCTTTNSSRKCEQDKSKSNGCNSSVSVSVSADVL